MRCLIECPLELRWRDLDALAHVNHASFLTLLEEARLRWFASLDGAWRDATATPVLAAIHVNYRAQLGWPARVAVRLFCERLGNTSLTLAHRLHDVGAADSVYADGNSVLVWVDPTNGKPVPVPEVVRRACG
jgi:acyl-CoA thioester hydrolase